jgi:hypothetical protein
MECRMADNSAPMVPNDDGWTELRALVCGNTDPATQACNWSVAGTAQRIAALAEQTADLVVWLKEILAVRDRCQQEAASYLSMLETLRYLSRLYVATAPHGVDYTGAESYASLHLRASEAREACRSAIASKGQPVDYPLGVTHPEVMAELRARAQRCRDFIADRDLTDAINSIPAVEREAPLVVAAMYRLNVALAMLAFLVQRTDAADELLGLFGDDWLYPASAPPAGHTMLSAAVSYFLTFAAPLPGPDCLLQAALSIKMFDDLAADLDAMKASIVDAAGSIRKTKYNRPSLKRLERTTLQQYIERFVDSFGDRLASGGDEAIKSFLLENYSSRRIKSDFARRAAIDDVLEKYLKEPELGYDAGGRLGIASAVLDLLIIYDSWVSLGEAWNGAGDPVTIVKSSADLVSAGLPAAALGLQLAALITPETAAVLGKVASVVTVFSALIGLGTALEQLNGAVAAGDADAILAAGEQAAVATAQLASAGLLLFSVCTTGAAAATAALAGNVIALGVIVFGALKYIDTSFAASLRRSEPGKALVRAAIDQIDGFVFTVWQDPKGRRAVDALGLAGAVAALRDAHGQAAFFGMPPLFALDAASQVDSAATDFETFCPVLDRVVEDQWTAQKTWGAQPVSATAAAETTARDRCVAVLRALHVPASVAPQLLYWDRATLETSAPAMLNWTPENDRRKAEIDDCYNPL